MPFGEVIEKPSPTARPCSAAQPSSTIAPSRPSDASVRSEPSAQSNVYSPPTVLGSIELTTSLSPNASAPSWRSAVTPFTPGVRARVLASAGSVGDQPSAPVTTVVAAIRRSSEPEVVSRRPVGDDGDQRYQRDADHQRGRGHGRAAGVAHRVAAGELARRSRRSARPAGRATEASARTARAGRRSLSLPGAASRSAATGGTRVARHAGISPAASVTSVPTSSDTAIVRSANTRPASRQREVHAR